MYSPKREENSGIVFAELGRASAHCVQILPVPDMSHKLGQNERVVVGLSSKTHGRGQAKVGVCYISKVLQPTQLHYKQSLPLLSEMVVLLILCDAVCDAAPGTRHTEIKGY